MNSECFEFVLCLFLSEEIIFYRLLFEEFNLKGILREVGERKNETNLRRKKRKDALRLQLRMSFFIFFKRFPIKGKRRAAADQITVALAYTMP